MLDLGHSLRLNAELVVRAWVILGSLMVRVKSIMILMQLLWNLQNNRKKNSKITFFTYLSFSFQPTVQSERVSWGRVCGMWPVTGDGWQVTGDRWPVTGDKWHMTHDTRNMTHDAWQMTHDTWHRTHDTWHMTLEMWHKTFLFTF